MADHAAASPSSAAMWMNCPASITKAQGRTRPSSRWAQEGTVAHMMADMILGGEIFPPAKVEVEGKEFITGPMFPHLHSYVDHCRSIMEFADEWYTEQRVALRWNDEMVWGTTDFCARTGSILDIVDLKYGQGVPVDPDTAQLKIYALAAWDTFWPNEMLSHVRLTVVQPRLDAVPKILPMSAGVLAEWNYEVLQPAIDRIARFDQTEKAGSWCRWCVRKAECDAFASHKSTIAAELFDDGVDLSDA